jgi:salicylate hydroxylase
MICAFLSRRVQSMANNRILVSGGGLGGLSCALALAERGFEVVVLEKAPEFTEIGYGIQLGPNATRILKRFGLWDAAAGIAVFPEAMVFLDAIDMQPWARIDFNDAFAARFKHPYVVIHRRDLLGLWLAACRAHPRITLRNAKGLAKIADKGSHVEVECEDGSTFMGRCLVGCEGLLSPTRAYVVGDGAPNVTGFLAYRGVIPMERLIDRTYERSVIGWFGHNIHLVQYGLRAGDVLNNVAVFKSPAFAKGEEKFGTPEELRAVFEPAHPKVRAMLEYIDLDRNWMMRDRHPVADWTRGNVTLLGDAAHPTLQYLAQGACMAFEDAVVLADRLSRTPDDPHRAFLDYQAARYLRCARVVLTARAFSGVLHVGGIERDLRNAVYRPRTPDSLHYEVDWIYRGIPETEI